ncbi:MAG: immunoglobulin domain-containing protein [Verrucomicrobia bacterium]|nr:immunoglobulin domain-containing protein [Verrucomicrobiota bacterium]
MSAKIFKPNSLPGFAVGCGLLILMTGWLGGTAGAATLTITNQPVAVNVSAGSAASFSVTAVGTPPLFFQWRLNGVNIPGQTNSYSSSPATDNFSIQSVQPVDAGGYSVVVWNSEGALNSVVAPLVVTNIPVLPASDAYSGRPLLNPSGGVGRTTNTNASKESFEPDHGSPPSLPGKPGNRSVWFKWHPTTGGIATFHTRGSGFDTTLGIYTNTPTGSLATLVPVAGDDDSGGFLGSAVSFNVVADTEYEIAVDGFYGARGNITLTWALEQTTDLLPVILVQPRDKTVGFSNTVSLAVQVDASNPEIESIQFLWQRDGTDLITAGGGSALVLPNVNAGDVGNYAVKVTQTMIGGNRPRTITSAVAQVQINSRDGGFDPNAIAQSKFRDESDTGSGLNVAAPAAGYSGSQLFSTFGAVKEPGEPNHCGEAGGASYWYSYQPPVNGTLTVDAVAAFNNILAIYTGSVTDFLSLASVACSSTNNAAGRETAVFAATGGTVYYIVSDGVGGASGNVTLTYTLAAPPVVTSQPASRTVVAGSNATLSVTATGTTPLAYQWRTNGINYTGRTTNSMTVTNFTAAKEGGYAVVITNVAGAVTSVTAQLYLIASNGASRFTNWGYATNKFTATLLGSANTNYIVQGSTNFASTWSPIITNSSGVGIISFSETNAPGYTNRFFRARAQ